ncbi:MAG: DUF2157 domain-containing protein [Elusimicrobiaceae bacterium]|nr:DUF2157 domain-containing protein [Elusimicrobiaceae bacterium]
MSLSKKLNRWKEQQFITQEQCDKILSFERGRNNHLFWRSAFIFAGLLIGLGICLLVAANWDSFGAIIKLTGDFILLASAIYAVYWSVCHECHGLRELFCIVSFALVGASIGLIAQVFQLDGGWASFAISWALLGLPFIWLSRVLFFNIVWWFLVISGLPDGWISGWIEHLDKQLVIALETVAAGWLLSYVGQYLDKKYGEYTRLAGAFEKVTMWLVYITIAFVGLRWGLNHWHNIIWNRLFAHVLVFGFLGMRMYVAIQTQNLTSFKRNAILAEIYLFCIFASRLNNLSMSGLGFIAGGFLVLGLIYALRKTSHYIKNMEAFK